MTLSGKGKARCTVCSNILEYELPEEEEQNLSNPFSGGQLYRALPEQLDPSEETVEAAGPELKGKPQTAAV